MAASNGSEYFEIEINGENETFARPLNADAVADVEAELLWTAIERLRLPSQKRTNLALLRRTASESDGGEERTEMVDLRQLDRFNRELVVKKALATTEQDNYMLLSAIKGRLDRVGLEISSVEVRFENLNITANVQVGLIALPTLVNYVRDSIEHVLTGLKIIRPKRHSLTILNTVSGYVKSGRITLLLGPPSSGKSTLLLALAGKLDTGLKKSGNVTYNGLKLEEFCVQRTSAYISQTDNHIADLTVREILDFAARCQGASDSFAGYMEDLTHLEKERNIRPSPEIDAFMKASSVGGRTHSVVTDYILKVLGLDVCSKTLVGNDMLRGVSGGQRKRVTTGDLSLYLLGLTELGKKKHEEVCACSHTHVMYVCNRVLAAYEYGIYKSKSGSSREEATPIPFNIAATLMTLWSIPFPHTRVRECLEDPNRTYFLEEASLPISLYNPSRLLVLKHKNSLYFEIFHPQSREFTFRNWPRLRGVIIRGYSFEGWLLCSRKRALFYHNLVTGELLKLPRAPFTFDELIVVFEGPPLEDNNTKIVRVDRDGLYVKFEVLTHSEGVWDSKTYVLAGNENICGLVLHEGNLIWITADANLHVLTQSGEHFSQNLPFLINDEGFGLYSVSIVTGGESMYLICVGWDNVMFHEVQQIVNHVYNFTAVSGFGSKCIYATANGSGRCFLADQPSEEGRVFFGCRDGLNRQQCWVIDVVDGEVEYEPQVIKECSAEEECSCSSAWIRQ